MNIDKPHWFPPDIIIALRKSGVLAVWSATSAPRFTALPKKAGFRVSEQRVRVHKGKGSRHAIWLASRAQLPLRVTRYIRNIRKGGKGKGKGKGKG